jgi:hypothetical protein
LRLGQCGAAAVHDSHPSGSKHEGPICVDSTWWARASSHAVVTPSDADWAIEQVRRRGQLECRVAGLRMPLVAWCAAVNAAAARAGVRVVTHAVPPDSEVDIAHHEQLVIVVLVDSTLVVPEPRRDTGA